MAKFLVMRTYQVAEMAVVEATDEESLEVSDDLFQEIKFVGGYEGTIAWQLDDGVELPTASENRSAFTEMMMSLDRDGFDIESFPLQS